MDCSIICALCGYERKYASKLLSGARWLPGESARRGADRLRVTGKRSERCSSDLARCGQPCGKRLHAALPTWLPFYERHHGGLLSTLRSNLLSISPATIDRLLAPCRASMGSRGRCGTRPGTLLRSHIPIRTEHWDVNSPGYMEADTVALCGESMAGEFCWSVTLTDIHRSDRKPRGMESHQHLVQKRIAQIETALPFSILGFDSDNGDEFLNWHCLITSINVQCRCLSLVRALIARTTMPAWSRRIGPTCANWSVMAAWKASRSASCSMISMPTNEFFRNFFCPVMKHLRTVVEGSRKRRVYDRRPHLLSDSSKVAKPIRKSWPAREALRAIRSIVLKHIIEAKL